MADDKRKTDAVAAQPRPGQTASTPDAQAGKLFGPETVTVMSCRMIGSNVGASFVSYSSSTGQVVEQREVVLAPVGGLPEYLCQSAMTIRSQQQIRQLFNKDYTLLAGTRPGANGGQQADAFDLRTGQAVGPPPDPNAFSVAPRARSPLFQPGSNTLWYLDDDSRRIFSREAGAAPATAVERRNSTDYAGFIFAGDKLWTPIAPALDGPGAVAVNPSGTAAVTHSSMNGPILVRNGQIPYREGIRLGTGGFGDTRIPGGADVPYDCVPRFWRSDTVYVCADETQLIQVTFAPGLNEVTAVDRLLAENSRQNKSAMLSPDGKSIVFLSVGGAPSALPALFRLPLDTPGATPVKICDVGVGATLVAYE